MRAGQWAYFWVALVVALATPLPASSNSELNDIPRLPELRPSHHTAAREGQISTAVRSMLRSLSSMIGMGWWSDVDEDGETKNIGHAGAINEKSVVGARKATALAPVLHASFGLDHYPNYLQRWDIKAIEDLEDKLESQLATVRAQKAMVSLP